MLYQKYNVFFYNSSQIFFNYIPCHWSQTNRLKKENPLQRTSHMKLIFKSSIESQIFINVCIGWAFGNCLAKLQINMPHSNVCLHDHGPGKTAFMNSKLMVV